jgi:ectoine hydroxylase
MHDLASDHRQEWHRLQLAHQGCTVVREVIPPGLLAQLQDRLRVLVGSHGRPGHGGHAEKAEAAREVRSLFEVDPLFDELMDLDPAFGICSDALGGDITLGQGGHGHRLPPRSPAHCGWHRDGPDPYLRCTWLLSDVAVDGGAFTLLPGTHRASEPPPDWFNAPDGQPLAVPGMVPVVGAAGDCLINHTFIWHTNTPNRSDRERLVVWVLYKPSTIRQWNQYGDGAFTLPRVVAERQRDRRRQALCAVDFVR